LRAKRGWIVALGIVYFIAGLIALGSVVMATIVSVFVVGIMMLIAGVAEVFHAFQIKTWGRFLLWFLLGVLYIVADFLTFENPLLAAALLTLLLGVSLIASGIMRIVLAFNMKEGMPWIWVVLSRRDHPSSRPHYPGALAGLQPLHLGAVPRHRSRLCRRRLDSRRFWSGKARVGACAYVLRLSSLAHAWRGCAARSGGAS
jgi:hypothetical protein